MPGLFAVKLQTPDLSAPPSWSGLITTVFDASVMRGINRAGTFSVSFPMSANEADQVVRGWHVTLLQERIGAVDSAGADFEPPALLYQGRVLQRTPVVGDDGSVTMTLDGETFLGRFADIWIQSELAFSNSTLDAILSVLVTPLGITYTLPARCSVETLTVTFSDLTLLQALIRLAELTRTNLVDTFVDSIRFTDQDNLPNPSINVNADDDVLRLINVEHISLDSQNALFSGFGIIIGVPAINYDGSMLANRIKVVGTDFDGNPLTLQGADDTATKYQVQSAAGPLGNYYFVEDLASQALYGRVETQLVRSDMKNPSDNQYTRAATKQCLLAIACGELLKRRSEILTLQVQIAGEDCYALPGEKVWVRYYGEAVLRDRTVTTVDLDQWMLVTRRGDMAGEGGLRLVSLDVSTPELAYSVPDLPGEIAVVTPDERQQPPEREPKDPKKDSDSKPDPPAKVDPSEVAAIMDMLKDWGALQPCCADPMADVGGNPDDNNGVHPPPGKARFTVETPNGNFPCSTMQEAIAMLRGFGVDYRNVPFGYDIIIGDDPPASPTAWTAETPYGNTSGLTFAGAVAVLASYGVDYRRTPYGYDITTPGP